MDNNSMGSKLLLTSHRLASNARQQITKQNEFLSIRNALKNIFTFFFNIILLEENLLNKYIYASELWCRLVILCLFISQFF